MWPVASKWTCWWYDSKLSYWYQFKEHILSFKMVHRWRRSDFGNSRYELKKHIYSYYFLYISRTLLAYISKECLPTTCPFWRDGSHIHDIGELKHSKPKNRNLYNAGEMSWNLYRFISCHHHCRWLSEWSKSFPPLFVVADLCFDGLLFHIVNSRFCFVLKNVKKRDKGYLSCL